MGIWDVVGALTAMLGLGLGVLDYRWSKRSVGKRGHWLVPLMSHTLPWIGQALLGVGATATDAHSRLSGCDWSNWWLVLPVFVALAVYGRLAATAVLSTSASGPDAQKR